MSLPRISALDCSLLVIDIQEKLLVAMPDAPTLLRDVGFLMDAAKLVQVPLLGTEQYPKGLGPTAAEIARRLPGELPAKVAFSSCGAPGVLADLRSTGRKKVVLVGMETHVCILHTALDLIADGFEVFLPVDGLQSRFRLDHDTALRRLERAGATLTTVETTAFEWLGGADHPQFKAVSKLIRERMATLAG